MKLCGYVDDEGTLESNLFGIWGGDVPYCDGCLY